VSTVSPFPSFTSPLVALPSQKIVGRAVEMPFRPFFFLPPDLELKGPSPSIWLPLRTTEKFLTTSEKGIPLRAPKLKAQLIGFSTVGSFSNLEALSSFFFTLRPSVSLPNPPVARDYSCSRDSASTSPFPVPPTTGRVPRRVRRG